MTQAASVDRPLRLPLVQEQGNRNASSDKDAKLVNCYAEKQGDDYWIFKRPGIIMYQTLAGIGRGMFNWRGEVYSVNGTSLEKVAGTSPGLIGFLDIGGTGEYYWFSSCQGATPKMFMKNAHFAYTYDGTNIASVPSVAPNYPIVTVGAPAYLDGTMYVMDPQGFIHGSDINNPLSWDPLNVIKAQVEPDVGISLAKHLTFIVAFKSTSTEFFFDAGNAAGSPLQANLPAKLDWGCLDAMTIQPLDSDIFWMANNKSAQACVMKMTNGQALKVSTKAVDRVLAGSPLTNLNSWTHKEGGHRFYGITSAGQWTMVLDIDEGVWSYWNTYNPGGGVAIPWPMVANCSYGTTVQLQQHGTNGIIYAVNQDYPYDDGIPWTTEIYTPNADLNTRRMKMVSSMEFIGDQQPASTLQVSCSDDDYATWSVPRTVDLSVPRPMLYRCGAFHRRAYRFQHSLATPFHLKAVEMQIDIGTL